MFRGLRLRLTLLYLFATITLTALVGVATYQLVSYYFQTTNDLALQHRMVLEFRALGIATPAALAAADRQWYGSQQVPAASQYNNDDKHTENKHEDDEHSEAVAEEATNGELAAIFVLPLSPQGQLLTGPNTIAPPFAPNQAAIISALTSGYDWRTVRQSDGTRIRLFTYSVPGNTGTGVLQLGRTLADQDHILSQLLTGLLALGLISIIFISIGSWWLAGRSLLPAQQAWERQQAFIANASHELRTPLTLIRASTEVAIRDLPVSGAAQRGLLQDVLQECDHMSHLVEDLLLLSRLDAGHLKIERKAIQVQELFADIERQVGRLAAERRVQVIAAPSQAVVLGDPVRLRQVCLILCDNALQHTNAGGTITLAAAPRGNEVVLSITDTGSGIAPQDLPYIFDRFFQSSSGNESGRGAGLGLSIAKGLVEAQQGTIAIESRIGEGTRVSIALANAHAGPRKPLKVHEEVRT
jgi:signal transduction histidine kinase